MDMMTNDGGHCVGRVLEDVGDRYCKFKLTTNKILTLKNPRFDRYEGTYLYQNNNGSVGFVINHYWPIRILINKIGHGNLPLNRLEYNTDYDSISIIHSS